MSGIPGIFHRDGRPVDPAALARMIDAVPERGPDGARVWRSGPIAFGFQWLRLDGDEARQPIVDDRQDLAIAFDGRIDNRDELVACLAAETGSRRELPDARIALDAYKRWGQDCPVHLIGDFAFAIWDGRSRSVFCARDTMGIKPFYYALAGETFVWGSDVRQILGSGYVDRAPNEGMIAEYLSFGFRSQEETFYRGVMRLPAAHSMTVDADGARMSRYWALDPSIEVRHETNEGYAEQFFSIFQEAVRCRLPRHERRVGAYLSGGLDSSSVVVVASALGWSVDTFSLVFPTDEKADERRYIDAVLDRWGLTSNTMPAQPIDGDQCRALIDRRSDVPDLPADLVAEPLRAEMRARGHRVVLTGIGGDYGFGGTFYHYADILGRGDVAELWRQLCADLRMADRPFVPIRELLLSGVRPLLPEPVRRGLRPIARRLGWMPALPDWIDPDLIARVGLADRLRPAAPDPRARGASQQYVLDQFSAGWPYLILERVERYGAERGIEERHPFFDRRVIEFALAIPEAQRWQGEHAKFVVRQALKGLLPEAVSRRMDKGDFSRLVPDAVESLGGAGLLDNLHIASLGWVRQAAVSAKYRNARRLVQRDAEMYCREMFHLWMIAGVELWYRSVFLEADRSIHEKGTDEALGSSAEGTKKNLPEAVSIA